MADADIVVPVQNWDSSAKCPKCESNDDHLKIKWMTGGNSSVNGLEASYPANFEYLHMTCEKCGFQWLMQTADADEREKALKEAKEAAEEEKEEPEEDVAPEKGGHGRRVVRGGA